jgi:hypothetical protein
MVPLPPHRFAHRRLPPTTSSKSGSQEKSTEDVETLTLKKILTKLNI